jgi:hypothetical protein
MHNVHTTYRIRVLYIHQQDKRLEQDGAQGGKQPIVVWVVTRTAFFMLSITMPCESACGTLGLHSMGTAIAILP